MSATVRLAADQPTGLFLDGAFETGADRIAVRNPFTEQIVAEVDVGGPQEIERAVADARRHLPPPPAVERAEILERTADRVAARIDDFAHAICLEAGKPLRQARGEATRCVDTLRFAAIEARTLAGEMVPMEGSRAGVGTLGMVVREPVGVVGAISPFNFPLNLVAHKLAPAIAAGCPMVLKPAAATPLSALLLAQTLSECGLAPGALAVVTGDGPSTGGALVAHPDVAMISFTGSAAVGWQIRAAQPRKHVALELGNATPVIVAADADLDLAAERLAASGFTHAGQSCISVQRIYVARAVYTPFRDRLVAAVERLVVGDPADEATDVGPVITASAARRVADWVAEAVRAGARVLVGGDVAGNLITPCVLDGITADMKVSSHEVFGPVVGLAPFDAIDDAIALANDNVHGLHAGIFTARVDHALRWARRLHYGGVLINETPTFRADQQPYGGIKDSGNTREGPRAAILSMTEPKFIGVRLP